MPIVLVTGLPGHGKTLFTIARWRDEAASSGRSVFYDGIKDLALPWQPWEPQKWEELPPNSIMVIDEAQRLFPVRGRGQPPEWIEKLAMHRHLGLDFVLITQNPMLIDSFVRRLCDRHFHVIRKFGTHRATVHEFANGVKESVATSREGSIRHEWKYPADVFNLYKSAEVHTVKRRVPMRVYILLALPFLLLGIVWFIYQRLNPSAAAERSGAPPAGQPGVVRPVVQQAAGEVDDYFERQRPRVKGLAFTAKAYDELTKPVSVPYPAACISSSTRCLCYSDQATALDMSEDMCRTFVERGFFVAWKNEDSAPLAAATRPAAAGPAGGGPGSFAAAAPAFPASR